MNALVGTKLGMTQIFDEDRVIPVTVLRAGPCRVTQVKTPDRDGYAAVQLGYGRKKARRAPSGEAGHAAKAGVEVPRHLVEVRVDDSSAYELGQEFRVGHIFEKGMKADVTGVSKGKGFTGVMKRHNFSGQLASHGVHRVHRAPGSIGACATPSRVFKGMRMAGRMGSEQVTILNLEVVEVDQEHGLLLLRGAIPGAKGTVVVIRHGVKVGPQQVQHPPEEASEEVSEERAATNGTQPGDGGDDSEAAAEVDSAEEGAGAGQDEEVDDG